MLSIPHALVVSSRWRNSTILAAAIGYISADFDLKYGTILIPPVDAYFKLIERDDIFAVFVDLPCQEALDWIYASRRIVEMKKPWQRMPPFYLIAPDSEELPGIQEADDLGVSACLVVAGSVILEDYTILSCLIQCDYANLVSGSR